MVRERSFADRLAPAAALPALTFCADRNASVTSKIWQQAIMPKDAPRQNPTGELAMQATLRAVLARLAQLAQALPTDGRTSAGQEPCMMGARIVQDCGAIKSSLTTGSHQPQPPSLPRSCWQERTCSLPKKLASCKTSEALQTKAALAFEVFLEFEIPKKRAGTLYSRCEVWFTHNPQSPRL